MTACRSYIPAIFYYASSAFEQSGIKNIRFKSGVISHQEKGRMQDYNFAYAGYKTDTERSDHS